MSFSRPLVSTQDFIYAVARDLVPHAFIIKKFGSNFDIANGQPADIWSGGSSDATNQIYEYEGQDLVAAEILTVRSLSGLDVNTTGTGAWSVLVEGLSGAGHRQAEIVLLNGANLVDTTLEYLRQYRTSIITAGSTQTNQGDIYVETKTTVSPGHAPDKIRMSQIDNGTKKYNQTLMSPWTVPANYDALIVGINATLSKRNTIAACDVEGYVRAPGTCFQLKVFKGMVNTGSNINEDWSKAPGHAPPLSDLKITSGDPTASLQITAGYDALCIKIDRSIPG